MDLFLELQYLFYECSILRNFFFPKIWMMPLLVNNQSTSIFKRRLLGKVHFQNLYILEDQQPNLVSKAKG